MKKVIKENIFLLLFLLISGYTNAETITSSMKATATLNPSCRIGANEIIFGSVIPSSNNLTTAAITSNCTKSTPYIIRINQGLNGSYENRTMVDVEGNATDKLNYNLYLSNTFNKVIGDGSDSTEEIVLMGNGETQTNQIYGKLMDNQYVSPGVYMDNIVVSLEY